MDLQRLEIKNYRSIRDLSGDDAIRFDGLDCLVGKNNAGKTNIISSVKCLLDEDDKQIDDEVYWNKDTSVTVDIRGYFEVTEEDLERVQDEEKREQIRELLLDEGDFDQHLGVCRTIEPKDEDGRSLFRVIMFRPADDHFDEGTFVAYRDEQWGRKDAEEGFTATDYRDAMQEEYPEVADYVEAGSERQKGAWKDAYDDFVADRPEWLEYKPKPAEFPQGTKQLVQNLVLPDVIKIPAIKEVEDSTQASGELGEITDALSDEIQEDLEEQMHEQLSDIYSQLDSDSKIIEDRLSDYLGEAFHDYAVELSFPRVESRPLFRDATIEVDDDLLDSDTLSTENVGEGVRRVLIFSMLRTVADLRDGSLAFSDGDDDEDSQNQPLLILYEEAELFLHPNLQKILLRVFRSLTDGEAQIIFNTHSPILVQNQIIDTINIVRKWPDEGSLITQFHTVLESRSPSARSRLLDLQKVSSYIFSDRVVLVEGRSDALVLMNLAPKLDSDWEFESQGIPILPVEGKGNFPLFSDFLKDLGLDVFIVADIGALRETVPRLLDDDNLIEAIEELREVAGSLVDDGEVEHRWNQSSISKFVDRYNWDETFDILKDLEERLEDGREYDTDHIDGVKRLTDKRAREAWRDAITSDHDRINADRLELRERILQNDILVLRGQIEDYYPDNGSSNKIEAALEFSQTDPSSEDLRENFVETSDGETTDIELFYETVFSTPTRPAEQN